jgi:hypothetical protein
VILADESPPPIDARTTREPSRGPNSSLVEVRPRRFVTVSPSLNRSRRCPESASVQETRSPTAASPVRETRATALMVTDRSHLTVALERLSLILKVLSPS